jgi:tetratricopeptide (TPR) repeat protein
MYFSSPNTFFNEEFPAVKTFISDSTGHIVGYKRNVDGKEYPNAIKITNPETLKSESMVFHEISLYLFENKRYAESAAYLKRAVELFPEDLELLLNLANMYLYNNEYDKAIAIHKAHLNDDVGNNYTWTSLLQFYIDYYRDKKNDVQIFEKLYKDLNLEWEK